MVRIPGRSSTISSPRYLSRLLRGNRMSEDLQGYRGSTVFNSAIILFFVAVSLFVALLHRSNDLALLAVVVLITMALSKVWSRVSYSRVTCDIHSSKQRLFPGETLALTTTIENGKFLPVWIGIRWSPDRGLKSLDDGPPSQDTIVFWYQQARSRQNLQAVQRGLYQLGPSYIQTSDFFGFFRTGREANQTTEVIVYPRLIDLNPVFLEKSDLFGTPGTRSPVKDPVYISGTRDYQPSRPSRHIHWKASARRLRLQEKVFEPSEQGKVLIILDVDAFSHGFNTKAFESTLEVIASLALMLDGMGYGVGFKTNAIAQGQSRPAVPTRRSPHQVTDILETLARLQMKAGNGVKRLVDTAIDSLQGAGCVMFSFENHSEFDRLRHACRYQQIPFRVYVCHSHQKNVPENQPMSAHVTQIADILMKVGDPF